MSSITEVARGFPIDLQEPVIHFWEAIKEELGVKHEDFQELKAVVFDLAVAQKKTEERLEELAISVDNLAVAQKRTEDRVEELAAAQKKTEETIQLGFKSVHDSIAALGGRWGLQAEDTFRNTVRALLTKTGYSVDRGYFGDREVDLVIKNGRHILLEITSSLRKIDIRNYNLSADDYQKKTGYNPELMVAAIYISPTVMRELIDSPRPIELFSVEEK